MSNSHSTVEATAEIRRFEKLAQDPSAAAHAYVGLLGLRTVDPVKLRERVEKGFSYSAFERLGRAVDLPMQELGRVIRIRPRTLSRRRKSGHLEPDESDRLLRTARIFGQALELFEGDVAAAREWLASAQPGLGGVAPLEVARTELGARQVEALIGRLEHGIPT